MPCNAIPPEWSTPIPYRTAPHRTVIIVIVYINDEEYISIGNDNSIFVHVYQVEFVSCSCNKHSLSCFTVPIREQPRSLKISLLMFNCKN